MKTKIRNIEVLKQALKNLGIAYTEAAEGTTLSIKGWEQETAQARISIETGCSYPIGVTLNDKGEAEFVADWWAIETWTERKQTDILAEFTRQYAYETVMDKVRSSGYDVVTEESDSEERVRVVVRKWT
ncbi:DUF1257 domain-containing protein [Alkalispirochaeta americana]|uniref:DUF1257 domain-containing protein n=1 Tax=Alkalispirochaeta americana TaxID=159291 RepID=UPI001F33FD56|nr:DUF1257 domain-containing protein [Alkalispirochaeta americana]